MTKTMFDTLPDEFVMAKLRENFEFLTGVSFPRSKGVAKGAPKGEVTDPKAWFLQMSFLHMVFFNGAQLEAKKRGLLSVVETKMVDDLLAALDAGWSKLSEG